MEARHITFDAPSHTYRDEYDNLYTSVTQKLNLVTPKFNTKFWREKKAKERGVPVSVILAEWNKTRDDACDRGNEIHGEIEESIEVGRGKLSYIGHISQSTTPLNPIWGYEISMAELQAIGFHITYSPIYILIANHVANGWKLYAEKRVYSVEHLIAGTIDLILIKDKEFKIIDWKTNKDGIRFDSGYYKKYNGIKTNEWVSKDEYLLEPLSHIRKSKGEIYTLQVSIYALICELWGFRCTELIMYHIGGTPHLVPNDQEYGTPVFTMFLLRYRKDDALRLLEWSPRSARSKSNILNFDIK